MSNSPVRKLTAIMFTDIKGYTALVQHDETDAMQKIDKYRQVLEELTAQHQGKVIEFYGDGALCVFDSVIECIQCGMNMQKAYATDITVPVRMGIHFGDILFKDDTVYGDGVNLASRIEAQGVPGSILISEKVNRELFNHPEIVTKSIGHFKLKNVTEPVHVFGIEHPDLVFPNKHFEKTRKQKIINWIAYLLVAIVLVGGLVFYQFNKGIKLAKDDQVSIEEFTNLTPYDSLSFIGNIAGHYITEGLTELPAVKVYEFQSKKQIEILQANLGRNEHLETKATKKIKGRFQLIGRNKDSISIKANLIDLSTNLQVHTFREQLGPLSDPMVAIQKLQNEIMGYWASKDDHLAGDPPNYEAYKAYITARDYWDEDDELVEEKLNLAIKLDPDFLASYFLLTSLYQNQAEFEKSKGVLNELRKRINVLNDRQRSMFSYYDNVQKGKNKLAFEYYVKDYINDKKDLFVNTSMAVIALEKVNAPQKALDYLKEIPIDSLDFRACAYCVRQWYNEMLSNIKIGNLDRAKQLLTKLPDDVTTLEYIAIQIRLAILLEKPEEVESIINDAPKEFYAQLNYIATREFRLANNEKYTEEFAEKSIKAYYANKDWPLASLYLFNSQPDTAVSITDTLLTARDSSDNQIIYYNGIGHAMLGNKEVALKMIRLFKDYEYSFGQIPYYQAGIYAQLGETQKALEKIKEAVDQGARFEAFDKFETDPFLLSLKDIPKYQELIHPLQ